MGRDGHDCPLSSFHSPGIVPHIRPKIVTASVTIISPVSVALPFLERDLFDDLFQRMVRLLDFCPTERYLVHGNYSLRNILTHEGKITGVVDWLDAKYGDFVYDIAGLDFWIPELRIREDCQHYYQQRLGAIPFYEERVLCYECYIAMSAMRFFAKKGDEGGYQWVRRRIGQLSACWG